MIETKIKDGCLDVKVWDPSAKKGVVLRYLEKGLYDKFSKLYPDYFVGVLYESGEKKKVK